MHLTTGNTIEGLAGTSSVITYTITGTSLGSSVSQVLVTGQLSTTTSVLYTIVNRVAQIDTIILANTSSSPVSGVILTLNGSTPNKQIIGELIIPANGTATYCTDGHWQVIDANGGTTSAVSISLTGDATGTLTAGVIPVVLATVNPTTGIFGDVDSVPVITTNNKGLITNVVDTPIQITQSQVTGLIAALAGLTPTLIEEEIDFGSLSVQNTTFTIIDANVTTLKKVVCYPSATPATGRLGNDWELDSALFTTTSNNGSFTLYTNCITPIIGKRNIQYQII